MRPFPSRARPDPPAPRLAWLFDIDGTLLLTEGASREAFSGAVRDVFGVENDLRAIPFAGRTEPLILADIMTALGRTLDEAGAERFWSAVFAHMDHTLRPGRGSVLPGVHALLDAIDAEPAWVPGLLTGNMTGMARVKLAHYGLAERFAFGAFGEEAKDRNALARLAAVRVERSYQLPPERCIVIGDTEHDITCARAAGMPVVAVASGMTRRPVLEDGAPDLLLDDLTDTTGLLAWARELEERTRFGI